MSTTVPTLVPPGFEFRYFEETVTLTSAAANYSLTNSLPIGAVPYAASLQLVAAIAATTAVKVGLGRITSTADPDKYILSANLTAQAIATMITPVAPLAAAETIGIFACDTNGAAAGTLSGVGGVIKVSMTYAIPLLPT